jgi:alpha-L-fucosidase
LPPTLETLVARPVPEWYEDAKFGIFIHWGLFSIPAFASRHGTIAETFRDRYDIAVAETPYTEWYANAIKVPESETAAHHRAVWSGAPYEDFREPFLKGLEQWDPAEWARTFAAAGARYVVLVTKHHDGFCLWPSAVRNPHAKDWTAPRDIVGELAAAVRAQGMRFGVYYSGGIDWTFNPAPLRTLGQFVGSVPRPPYGAYAQAQVRELIERTAPSVLWNDISWPQPLARELALFADYYDAVPDGVVNDRWVPTSWRTDVMRSRLAQSLFDRLAKRHLKSHEVEGVVPPLPPHCDFRTPEYTTFPSAQAKKWEATRGMSHSFGYNARDADADLISVDDLVRGFVDTVSKNGNLLLNVGPRGADARIPDIQRARLEGFGRWMAANGDGIVGTRPWTRAQGTTADGLAVRFTAKPGAVYAHLLGTPSGREIVLQGADLAALPIAGATLLPGTQVRAERSTAGLVLTVPEPLPEAPAHGLRLEVPDRRMSVRD